MEPKIGRSLQQGFLAANKSWAGIGVFAGSWMVVIMLVLTAATLTNPPPQLFESQPPATPAVSLPLDQHVASAPATPSERKTDLFKQFASSDTAAPSSAPAPQATAPASQNVIEARRQELAERDRLAGEWFNRAWPVLLLCVLLVVATNLWLHGGQISYLAQRLTTGQARVAEFWIAGKQAFGALLGVGLLSLAGFATVLVTSFLTLVGLSALARVVPRWAAMLLAIVGVVVVVMVVAGLVWLSVRLSFWFIAIVTGRVGTMEGLRRSFRVSQGHWWTLASLGLLTALMSYSVWVLVGIFEWVGNLMGGPVAVVTSLLGNVGGVVGSLYVGFAMLGAYLRVYEDLTAPSESATSTAA